MTEQTWRLDHEARQAMRQAWLALTLAERCADEDIEQAREHAIAARTFERMAEYSAIAAMLGKDCRPRE